MKQNMAELSFEIHLFHSLALVNHVANKWESIHARWRELPQLYSRYKIYQISRMENKSVSSAYVYYVSLFFRWLCVFVGFIWGKGKKLSRRERKNG